jgi:hypothetical protein
MPRTTLPVATKASDRRLPAPSRRTRSSGRQSRPSTLNMMWEQGPASGDASSMSTVFRSPRHASRRRSRRWERAAARASRRCRSSPEHDLTAIKDKAIVATDAYG